MGQGKFRPSSRLSHKKSKGAMRKDVGRQVGKTKGSSMPPNRLRDAAGKIFARAVEADLASRLPSDQRDKLTVLRNAPSMKPLIAGMKKKHMKKPLTRGRKRKALANAKGMKRQ